MKDKELVTCLETSKLLKVAGFPQDKSYFKWVEYINLGVTCYILIRSDALYVDTLPHLATVSDDYAAPTTDELLKHFYYWLWYQGCTLAYPRKPLIDGVLSAVTQSLDSDQLLPEALALLWIKVKGGLNG